MSTELAKPKNDLRSLLSSESVKSQIALALPKHMTSDRMARVALTAVNKNPKLLECSPSSVLSCLMSCSAIGLEPDGRNAHLIPYGKDCQLIVDYKGLVALATRNGHIVRAEKVCENDSFSYIVVNGTPELKHAIDWKRPRGNAYAYYATCVREGVLDVEVMTKDEVDAIRKRSRAANSGPWVSDYDEMAKKTVLRRMSKRWDISPEIRDALESDYDRPSERETVGMVIQAVEKPSPSLFAPVSQEDSQTGNGAQGEPATGLAVDAACVPIETPRSATPAPDMFEQEVDPLSEKMASNNITIDDLNRVIQASKLAKQEFESVSDIPKKLRDTLVKSWDSVIGELNK